ncbi:MAG: GH1 family beta-glucosidase [Pseudomonadales bacterium]|nr:GH1 family beta-glucosidase [Pseudomonadales bacterium]NRA13882.1 beta-glucosidase [Oceanospirillaceae bacterium]
MTLQLDLDSPLMQPDFSFGIATAAFQIEGANTADGRCESIWDKFCQLEGKVLNGDDGSMACDHYHLWREDIDLIESLGVDSYRLSIAWPRIINDIDGSVNASGLAFYDNIINQLNARNIKVFVTLYHWDLPQYLEDHGGWLNRDTVHAFVHYAEIISQHFQQRIYSYCTFNEPWCSAYLGYQYGVHAPGHKSRKMGLQAAHHLLLAHGLAVPVIRRHCGGAQVGIVLNFTPGDSASDSQEDLRATQIYNDYNSHWFIQPLMQGSYPSSIVQLYAEDQPVIEASDLADINVSIDFLGVNFYTRAVVATPASNADELFQLVPQADAEHTDIGWEIHPAALYKLLTELNRMYNLPPIYITENGAACDDHIVDGQIDDQQRCRYLQQHLLAVEQAVQEGVVIKGYFAWSLMDNFEWAEGYSKRFGIVYVDYKSQKRTLKKSAHSYRNLLNSRVFIKN